MQHAGSEWREEHRKQYSSYLTRKSHGLPDAIAFDYRDSVALGTKKSAVPSQRVVEPQEKDSGGSSVMADGSKKRLKTSKSKWKLFAFMLEAESVSKND